MKAYDGLGQANNSVADLIKDMKYIYPLSANVCRLFHFHLSHYHRFLGQRGDWFKAIPEQGNY
jgi:hypothetical protein